MHVYHTCIGNITLIKLIFKPSNILWVNTSNIISDPQKDKPSITFCGFRPYIEVFFTEQCRKGAICVLQFCDIHLTAVDFFFVSSHPSHLLINRNHRLWLFFCPFTLHVKGKGGVTRNS